MPVDLREGLVEAGRQDCSDMHSYGPSVRFYYIVHYIIRGTGYLRSGDRLYKITVGQSFVIRPFDNVRYYPDPDDPWEYAWIGFTGKPFVSVLEKTAFMTDRCIIGGVDPKTVMPYYEKLRQYYRSRTNGNTADGLTLALLGIYADMYPEQAPKSQDDRFKAACQLINADLHKQSFGVEELCRTLGISRATLHRSFVNSCGISPGEYIINCRIERAKELLKHKTPVKATAASCGFTDQLYFSRVFRSATGISPTEYKRLNSEN